jgi:hypothetical protein
VRKSVASMVVFLLAWCGKSSAAVSGNVVPAEVDQNQSRIAAQSSVNVVQQSVPENNQNGDVVNSSILNELRADGILVSSSVVESSACCEN